MPLCSATTAKGEPCRKHAMQGAELCAFHLGRAGRKTALEPDVIDRLEQMLKAGNYIEIACRAVGVPTRTFADWMSRGRSAAPGDEPYRELAERVEQALAEGEVRNVAQIAAAARDNWQAAAWLLERGNPERWGRVLDEAAAAAAAARGGSEPEADDAADDPFARGRRTRSETAAHAASELAVFARFCAGAELEQGTPLDPGGVPAQDARRLLRRRPRDARSCCRRRTARRRCWRRSRSST